MNWFGGLRRGGRKVVLTPSQQAQLSAWQGLPAHDLTRSHATTRYVVVDVETSGLNMKLDHLISIGAVAVADARIDFNDAFQVVLRQDAVSSNANILIHGIGGSAQSEGSDPADALLAFLAYVGKSPLVAYHAFFDQAMIDKAMRETLAIVPQQTWIDLAWVVPDLVQHRIGAPLALDAWLKLYDIESIVRHNAVSDAYATAKLLQIAIARGTQKGVATPASFLRIEKAGRWIHENR